MRKSIPRTGGTLGWDFWLTEKERLVRETVQARAEADFLQHGMSQRGLRCDIDRASTPASNVTLDTLKFRMVVCEPPCTAREAVAALNDEIKGELPGTLHVVLSSRGGASVLPFRMAYPSLREVIGLLAVEGADIRAEAIPSALQGE